MVDRLERRRFLGGGPLYNPQPKVPTSFTKPTVHFPFLSLGNFVFCFVLLVVDLGIFATHPDSPAPFSLRNYSLTRRPIIVSSISCSEVTNFPISRGFVAPFTFLWARFFVLQHGFNVEMPGMSASIAELYFFKIEDGKGKAKDKEIREH